MSRTDYPTGLYSPHKRFHVESTVQDRRTRFQARRRSPTGDVSAGVAPRRSRTPATLLGGEMGGPDLRHQSRTGNRPQLPNRAVLLFSEQNVFHKTGSGSKRRFRQGKNQCHDGVLAVGFP